MPSFIPRPFSQALNIGTDICSVQRVSKILRSRHAQAFIRRVLRVEEIAQNRRLLSAVDRLQELELLNTTTTTTTSERTVHQQPPIAQHERGEGPRQSQSQSTARTLPNSSIRALVGNPAAARTQGGKHGAMLEPGTTPPSTRTRMRTRARARHASDLPDAVLAVEWCAQFLAGRFAAKEAAMKAHHSRRLTYHSICILKPPPRRDVPGSVPPVAVVLPEEEEEEEESGGGLGRAEEVRISISHDGGFAVASCLARDEGGDGDHRMKCFAEAFRGGAAAGCQDIADGK